MAEREVPFLYSFDVFLFIFILNICFPLRLLFVILPCVILARRIVEIHDGFEEINGFPRVIGAVDGCHMRIKTPSGHPDTSSAQSSQIPFHNFTGINSFFKLLCVLLNPVLNQIFANTN